MNHFGRQFRRETSTIASRTAAAIMMLSGAAEAGRLSRLTAQTISNCHGIGLDVAQRLLDDAVAHEAGRVG